MSKLALLLDDEDELGIVDNIDSLSGSIFAKATRRIRRKKTGKKIRRTRKKSRKKYGRSVRTRKKSSKRRSSRTKIRRRKSSGKKRIGKIYRTRTGQPYKILSNGRARFIKRR